MDVALVSAEGNKVCLAVYLAPLNSREEKWQKIVVKEDFGNCHQLEVADVDLDGDLDLVGGRSFGESYVFVWYNQGKGARWTEEIVDREAGMYSGVVGDLGSDVDLVAPHSYARGQTVWIFENLLNPPHGASLPCRVLGCGFLALTTFLSLAPFCSLAHGATERQSEFSTQDHSRYGSGSSDDTDKGDCVRRERKRE